MNIRDYTPNDFPLVKKLWKETAIFFLERDDTSDIILRCNLAGGKFLVLENPGTGKVEGTSWMTWDGRGLFLHHFAISPHFQGLGHGRTLALSSLDFAKEKNCSMRLEVHCQNTPAVNLYRSLGFEEFVDYDIYMILDPGAGVEH